MGSIHSAYVYYLPNYSETSSWNAMTIILILIPTIAIAYEWIIKMIKRKVVT